VVEELTAQADGDLPTASPTTLTLADQVAALATAIVDLRADLDEISTDDRPVSVARPWNWRTHTPGQRNQAWQELTEWVHWLVHRYRVDDLIPGCWPAHGALVEELSALHWAWRAAYTDPTARATDALTWHDQLERASARIRVRDRGNCAGGAHSEDPAPDYPEANVGAGRDAIDRDRVPD
jgi:hypothetical protein